MRNFWVTFKFRADNSVIEGDLVADMPQDGKLNADYMKNLKAQILERTMATMAQSEFTPKTIGNVLILACIPLEE